MITSETAVYQLGAWADAMFWSGLAVLAFGRLYALWSGGTLPFMQAAAGFVLITALWTMCIVRQQMLQTVEWMATKVAARV